MSAFTAAISLPYISNTQSVKGNIILCIQNDNMGTQINKTNHKLLKDTFNFLVYSKLYRNNRIGNEQL